MPPTQDSQNTFKPSLTCIFVSARTRYIMSIPNGRPCSFYPFLIFWCVVSVIFYLPIKAGTVEPEKVEKEEPVTEVSILSLNRFSFFTLMFSFLFVFSKPCS